MTRCPRASLSFRRPTSDCTSLPRRWITTRTSIASRPPAVFSWFHLHAGRPAKNCGGSWPNESIEYAEPDCDGPDFLTTSIELMSASTPRARVAGNAPHAIRFRTTPASMSSGAIRRSAGIPTLAARSLPRVVAVLDSGIDPATQTSTSNVMINVDAGRAAGFAGQAPQRALRDQRSLLSTRH